MANASLSVTSGTCSVTGFDHIEVEHDGSIGWAEMQSIKNEFWGAAAIGFELYPPANTVVNGNSTEFHYRHIWRWPDGVEWPNLRKGGHW